MPWENPDERRRKQREFNRQATIDRLREQGLEPLDINDPHSQLHCTACGCVSGRYANRRYRHLSNCYHVLEEKTDEQQRLAGS